LKTLLSILCVIAFIVGFYRGKDIRQDEYFACKPENYKQKVIVKLIDGKYYCERHEKWNI
jgi:hypothetical protein